MTNLFNTGIRPLVDDYLVKKAQEKRDYGNYWSASSAGYCQRKQILERLGCPPIKEDARKQRVFEAGHIFHEWVQRLTKDAGLSIAQELELQDESLMIRGHIDDLVLVRDTTKVLTSNPPKTASRLILYDYKTQNSRAFTYQKDRPMSYYHKMQVGTYLYMLRKLSEQPNIIYPPGTPSNILELLQGLVEARIMKISKDDLRLSEDQLLWTPELEKEVIEYWTTLNEAYKARTWPKCTCADHEGGFLAKEAYNPFYFEGEPCSLNWYAKCKASGTLTTAASTKLTDENKLHNPIAKGPLQEDR